MQNGAVLLAQEQGLGRECFSSWECVCPRGRDSNSAVQYTQLTLELNHSPGPYVYSYQVLHDPDSSITGAHKGEWGVHDVLVTCICVLYVCVWYMFVFMWCFSVCMWYVYSMIQCGVIVCGVCLVCFLVCSVVYVWYVFVCDGCV